MSKNGHQDAPSFGCTSWMVWMKFQSTKKDYRNTVVPMRKSRRYKLIYIKRKISFNTLSTSPNEFTEVLYHLTFDIIVCLWQDSTSILMKKNSLAAVVWHCSFLLLIWHWSKFQYNRVLKQTRFSWVSTHLFATSTRVKPWY